MIDIERTIVRINGLPVPTSLLSAMRERRWRCPTAPVLRRVFREEPVKAVLFDLGEMRAANERWLHEKDASFFGHRDDRLPPGDIDNARSLLLGMLGPDLPFALDFRSSVETPTVLYLHSGGDRWITVARHVDHLLSRLHLDGRVCTAESPSSRRSPQ